MKKLLLYWLLFIGITSASAYNLRQISNTDGLSNSAILSIYQDTNGLMWFGSCDGLNSFDGSDVSVYKSAENKNDLSGNMIEDIIETEEGIFWLQTNYGLNRLDKKKKQVAYFPFFNGQTLLSKDRDNTLFILYDDKFIHWYNPASGDFQKISLPELRFTDVLDLVIDRNNTLWLFQKDGQIKSWSIRKTGTEIQLSLRDVYQHDTPIRYCFHEEDAVYFIDNSLTLFEYDLVQRKKDYIFNLENIIIRRGDVSSVIKHGDDYYIGFKTNGLVALRSVPERMEKFIIEAIDIQSGIFCLLKDKQQDIIWVGTDGQGVFLYFMDAYSIRSTVFNNIPYKIEKPVRAVFLDKEHTLWIGTKGDGILKLKDYNSKQNTAGSVEHQTSDNSLLSDNSVYSFAESHKNIIWIGHDEGLNYYSYSTRKIQKIELSAQGKQIKYIHSICEVNDSTLWLASVGMGIIKADIGGSANHPVLKNVRQFSTADSTSVYNHFFTLYAENDSNIWFGNRGQGIFNINPATYRINSVKFGRAQNNQLLNDVFSITQDTEGNLWCGTSMGLVKYTAASEIVVYNENSKLPNNTVHGILRGSRNNLWLSTNRGIIRFDMGDETFQAYNENYGLKVMEFSDGAFYKDVRTGDLFFGGIDGFIVIDDTGADSKEYYPPVNFNSLSIFGKEYNIYDFSYQQDNQEVLQLNYNQNFFSLSFSANDYINGNNYSYFYRLSELNANWIDNNEARNIAFTNMKPGKYTLQVKYLNHVTGKESPVYQTILYILPPWYLSTPAYIAYILLVIISLLLTAYYFMRKGKRKQQAMLEQLRVRHQEEVYESKLRFFTNIAHEFCTPLTLIYGPCNRMLSYHASDRFIKQNTSVIQRNAERLNGLIQELIEFRRIETESRKPQIEQVSVSQLLYDIIKSFSEVMESKGFYFEHHIQPDLQWNTDRNFLYTVITNLLSNALKYTDYAGTIKMKAATVHDILEITVNNTGKGIRKEDYSHVFDRYSILDNFENKENNSIMRNGLGLAISHSMIKLLQGEITIESELHKDTSFIVRIPQHELSPLVAGGYNMPPAIVPQESSNAVFELPRYPMVPNKQTVFVIDDDVEILWLICEVFKEQYNVVPFKHIDSVHELFENIYPDIIISDIMMTGLDGISLVKQIKADEATNHIPLILISAKHNVDEQIRGVDAGADMYITKPFNIDFLKVSVSRLIKRKESLKSYFTSPLSAFDLVGGKKMHKEDKEFLEKILLIINANLTLEDLSSKFIAQQLNISVRQLYRKISDIGETTLAEMIKECKLHVAKNLLLNTQMTIDEIIYNSGFVNRSTFYNVFAAKFNSTPNQYRKESLSFD